MVIQIPGRKFLSSERSVFSLNITCVDVYRGVYLSMLLIALLEILTFVFIVRMALKRYSSVVDLISTVLFTSSLLLYAYVALPWALASYYLRYVALIGYLPALFFALRRARDLPWLSENRRFLKLSGNLFEVALSILMFFAISSAIAGSRRPPGGVDLTFPMKRGYIHQGGNTPILNYHNVSLSQRFALDISSLYPWGGRAKGIYPREPEKYAVYGDTLFSPCDCEVARVVDGFPDNPAGYVDTVNVAGNHVVLRMDSFLIVLAHIKRNSITVREGERVRRCQPIALVGNSGQTSEPHLHIHAVRSSDPDSVLKAPGVPIYFNGRFAVRNDVLKGDCRK